MQEHVVVEGYSVTSPNLFDESLSEQLMKDMVVRAARRVGFDEVNFDYIGTSEEHGMIAGLGLVEKDVYWFGSLGEAHGLAEVLDTSIAEVVQVVLEHEAGHLETKEIPEYMEALQEAMDQEDYVRAWELKYDLEVYAYENGRRFGNSRAYQKYNEMNLEVYFETLMEVRREAGQAKHSA